MAQKIAIGQRGIAPSRRENTIRQQKIAPSRREKAIWWRGIGFSPPENTIRQQKIAPSRRGNTIRQQKIALSAGENGVLGDPSHGRSQEIAPRPARFYSSELGMSCECGQAAQQLADKASSLGGRPERQ